MDVKGYNEMITGTNSTDAHAALIQQALKATDAYLGAEKIAVKKGFADSADIHSFTHNLQIAVGALSALGVMQDHEEYINTHIETMTKLFKHEDSSIFDEPYSDMPTAKVGEMEEQVHTKADAIRDAFASFKSYVSEEEIEIPELAEEEIAAMESEADGLQWEDIEDLYEDEEFEDEVTEVLSVQGRLKKGIKFRASAKKVGRARQLALRRVSSINRLQNRAKLKARRMIYSRLLRGRDKANMSPQEKSRIEQQVQRMGPIVNRIAQRVLPQVRKLEQSRLSRRR